MGVYKFQIVMSLVYILQTPQGQCQSNNSKSGIVDDYNHDIDQGTTEPGKDYSFYDTLDEKGRILFITGTCVLGVILLTMLVCYYKNHSCQISCGIQDATPPLVNMVPATDSQLNQAGIAEQSTHGIRIATSRQPSPRPSPTPSRTSYMGPAPSLSQQDIAMQGFNTSNHLVPSHSLWRYHSTGRMQTGVPGSPGPRIPNQELGNLSQSRFCASTGHLYPGNQPFHYPAEQHLSQGNLSRQPSAIHQSFGVSVPYLPPVPVPQSLPTIEIQAPSPPKKRLQSLSRWRSEGYLAAEVGAAGQARTHISPEGQLWRSTSTGLLCPMSSEPGGLSTQPVLSGGPSTGFPQMTSRGSRAQPSAPPLNLL